MRQALFCLLLLGLASPLSAAVYTYIDAEGNRVFTDRPPDNRPVEQIHLAPSNNMEARPLPPPTRVLTPPQPELRYEMLRILVPEPDATIRENSGDLIITATSEPGLHTGHRFRLVLDGQPSEPQGSPVFPLRNVDRGTHQIAVEIVDEEGRIIERTPSQPFHMKRISLADKRRVNPCQKDDWGVRPECPLKDKPVEKKDLPFVPFL